MTNAEFMSTELRLAIEVRDFHGNKVGVLILAQYEAYLNSVVPELLERWVEYKKVQQKQYNKHDLESFGKVDFVKFWFENMIVKK